MRVGADDIKTKRTRRGIFILRYSAFSFLHLDLDGHIYGPDPGSGSAAYAAHCRLRHAACAYMRVAVAVFRCHTPHTWRQGPLSLDIGNWIDLLLGKYAFWF